jgi:hypothetical protein
MRQAYLAALSLLTVAVGAANADIQLSGPATVPAYKLVRFTASSSAPGAAFIFDISPGERADAETFGDRVTFTGPAGTYTVKAWAVWLADGKTKVEQATATVTIGGTSPAPPPGPGPVPPGPTPPAPPAPGPGPSPLPVGSKLNVLVITDLARRTPAQAAVVQDVASIGGTSANQLRALGHEPRAYDTTSPAMQPRTVAGGLNYAAAMKAAGVAAPCVILLDGAGNIIKGFALPPTGAQVVAAVKAVAP